jgi:hypothetical protein
MEIVGRDFEDYVSAISKVHGPNHICNMSFAEHYRRHRKRGAEASEDEVIDYTIRMWRKIDRELGIGVLEVD